MANLNDLSAIGIDADKLSFLLAEIELVSWSAAVQRSKPYATPKPPESVLGEVRAAILSWMAATLLTRYRRGCSEKRHLVNLRQLIALSRKVGAEVFEGRGLRYGLAAKLLNTWLKGLWCLGLIPTPPHCPVDSVIQQRIPGGHRIPWTQMTTQDQYLRVICALQRAADRSSMSLAEWELSNFSRRRASSLNVSLFQGG